MEALNGAFYVQGAQSADDRDISDAAVLDIRTDTAPVNADPETGYIF